MKNDPGAQGISVENGPLKELYVQEEEMRDSD